MSSPEQILLRAATTLRTPLTAEVEATCAALYQRGNDFVVKVSLNCHSMLTGRSYKLSVRARR